MTTLFIILIILASVVLGFFVLVQNPKGGGLAGSVGGIGNQFMGVKQTTDVLEKGTWVCAAIIAILCLTSTFFISRDGGARPTDDLNGVGNGPAPKTAPAAQPVTPTNATPITPAQPK